MLKKVESLRFMLMMNSDTATKEIEITDIPLLLHLLQ
jgi:hypothetical protein